MHKKQHTASSRRSASSLYNRFQVFLEKVTVQMPDMNILLMERKATQQLKQNNNVRLWLKPVLDDTRSSLLSSSKLDGNYKKQRLHHALVWASPFTRE